MKVTSNAQNNNTNFTGIIKKSKLLYRQIEHAKDLSSGYTSKQRQMSLQFFNVLKAIKNDGTNNCLTLKRIYPKHGRYSKWDDYDGVINVKYGNFETQTENVIDTLIEWGESLFGTKVINAKPEEMKLALDIQKNADELKEKNYKIFENLSLEELKVQKNAQKECEKAFEDLLA